MADKEMDNVKRWLERIEFCKRYRTKQANRFHWKNLVDEYRGYFAGLQDSLDIYVPSLNLIFAYVKSEIPRLYLRDPKIKINPKNSKSILAAKILEKAVNYIWRTKRIKRENKKNILDVLLVGHSWFKTGYAGSFGAIEDDEGNTFEFIEKEDFFGYRVPFENITFNPDANDPPFDCTWIAHEVWLPFDEVKKNKAFKNVKQLQPMTADTSGDDKINKNKMDEKDRQDPVTKMVRLYEVWDKKNQVVFTIADGVDGYIKDPKPWPYEMKGFPFSFLRLNDDPLNPYGIPDCYMFEPQVLELMKIRATEIDHLKRYNRQLLVAEGHMSDDAMDQFMQGYTGAAIPVRTDGRPLGDIVTPIPYPALQTDIYAIEDRINMDIVNISGQNPSERGASQKTTTRTKSELLQIQQGSENRRSDKIDTIEDFIEDIAGNLCALLQQLADMPYYVRVAGDDVEEFLKEIENRPSAQEEGAITNNEGFTFTKEDIQGEFDFEVVAGSTVPMTQEQKNTFLMNSVEVLPKLGVQPGGPVARYIGDEIADGFDLAGLRRAIRQELEQAQEAAKARDQQAMEMVQMQAASEAAEIQIKAEREATRQADVELRAIEIFKNNATEEQKD